MWSTLLSNCLQLYTWISEPVQEFKERWTSYRLTWELSDLRMHLTLLPCLPLLEGFSPVSHCIFYLSNVLQHIRFSPCAFEKWLIDQLWEVYPLQTPSLWHVVIAFIITFLDFTFRTITLHFDLAFLLPKIYFIWMNVYLNVCLCVSTCTCTCMNTRRPEKCRIPQSC